MQNEQKTIIGILISICVVGLIGIQIGNPKFMANAIILESSFIILTGIAVWRIRYTFIPNIVIAMIVIIGNTASPRHIEIMSTFEPFLNGIILIIGGYILQGALLGIRSYMFIKQKKQERIVKTERKYLKEKKNNERDDLNS